MLRRVIDVSNPARLKIQHTNLVLINDEGEHRLPIEDIGFIVLNHPQISCTQAVLQHCAQHNIAVIVCDQQQLPQAMLCPFQAHTAQGKFIRMQANAPLQVQHHLWRQIVRAKISAQAEVIHQVFGEPFMVLERLTKQVEPGDATHCESQAARYYFKTLFGSDFKRVHQGASGMNAVLNYGYAIIRSACARAIIGAGLHPAFGVQHHNQYNVFCLADDIMEPLRPLVDLATYHLTCEHQSLTLNTVTKQPLLQLLATSVQFKQKQIPLMSALNYYCANLREVLTQHKKTLYIPTMVHV